MKALRDAGLLVAIAVAALTVRVSPVETPAPLPSPSVAQDSLLRVDIEDFEAAEWAVGAQLPAAAVLEDLEVVSVDPARNERDEIEEGSDPLGHAGGR